MITAADHLGELDCDETGQASVVEVRGTVHWLTHADGPARALSVEPARPCPAAPHPRHDRQGRLGHRRGRRGSGGRDAIQIAEIEPESAATAATDHLG